MLFRSLKADLPGLMGMPVPWADFEAFIAPEDPVAHQGAELLRDGTRVFNGEVSQASSRIQNIGLGKGLGGTDFQTTGAGTAVIFGWGIGIDFQVRQKAAEEEPRTVCRMDQKGVFALPPQSRPGCERFFHDR